MNSILKNSFIKTSPLRLSAKFSFVSSVLIKDRHPAVICDDRLLLNEWQRSQEMIFLNVPHAVWYFCDSNVKGYRYQRVTHHCPELERSADNHWWLTAHLLPPNTKTTSHGFCLPCCDTSHTLKLCPTNVKNCYS